MNIHEKIKKKLDYFIENKSVPNILLYGDSGSGKSGILNYFLKKTYKTQYNIQKLVMFINCNQCKSIKFIREELKFFAKSHIQNSQQNDFKSIILFNADNLTIDAQSALRRCIELFSHTTRFFIIVEDKFKLLKPILSRFSELYIPLPIIDNKSVNLHKYNIENNEINKTIVTIKKILVNLTDNSENIYQISEKLYNKGISGLDLIEYINTSSKNDEYKFKLLTVISKVKNELHNELTTIMFIINLIYNSTLEDLHSILEI